jgi:hypothetical protein
MHRVNRVAARERTAVPMREECKHYQSRTYASGEVARLCVLDLAPEAPWRCPDDCQRYERRMADAGWTHGSLVEPAIEAEPDDAPADIAALLSEADDVVNLAGPGIRAEVDADRARQSGWRRRFRKRS